MATTAASSVALLCVGEFAGVHGVRGSIRLRSFTADPLAIFDCGPLFDDSGSRCFHLTRIASAKQTLIVQVQGVADRDAARALTGARLYLPRDRLPALADEDEFYHADLIGCQAVFADGKAAGRVKAVHNFGAGDILELDRPGAAGAMLPFTKANVPRVDLVLRRLVVVLPLNDAVEEEEAS